MYFASHENRGGSNKCALAATDSSNSDPSNHRLSKTKWDSRLIAQELQDLASFHIPEQTSNHCTSNIEGHPYRESAVSDTILTESTRHQQIRIHADCVPRQNPLLSKNSEPFVFSMADDFLDPYRLCNRESRDDISNCVLSDQYTVLFSNQTWDMGQKPIDLEISFINQALDISEKALFASDMKADNSMRISRDSREKLAEFDGKKHMNYDSFTTVFLGIFLLIALAFFRYQFNHSDRV